MVEDSLQELTNENQIEELLRVIYSDFPHCLHYWNFVRTILSWKARNSSIHVQILVPNPQDLNDGTSVAVFAMSQTSEKTYMVYTLEASGNKLKHALLNTHRIDWSNTHREWEAIHERHMAVMGEVFQTKSSPGRYLHHYDYYMPLRKALALNVGEPSEGQLVRLGKDDASIVDKHWEYTSPESIHYTSSCIEFNFGFGLRSADNKLMSWVTQTHYGAAGQLYTVDTHRKKGYGEILMRHFTKHLAEMNENPTVTVGGENMASIKLNEKIGYERVCQNYWYL